MSWVTIAFSFSQIQVDFTLAVPSSIVGILIWASAKMYQMVFFMDLGILQLPKIFCELVNHEFTFRSPVVM